MGWKQFQVGVLSVGLVSPLITGCDKSTTVPVTPSHSVSSLIPANSPLAMILAPESGDTKLDVEIRKCQEQLRKNWMPEVTTEKLGWLFVAKARETFDPGFYRLAEQCGLVLDSQSPGCPEGLLLRGHVLQNLHRFHEAELLARQLVQKRERPFDFGLLGDTLMEQGELTEAISAYQRMIDLRPDLQSYSRAAHMRWLKGDTEGALELMKLAATSASPRDAESAAWAFSRMGFYQLASGDLSATHQSAGTALEFQPQYPPALLIQGKAFLAENKPAEALPLLKLAAELNQLPEYLWAYRDSLQQSGDRLNAAAVTQKLLSRGESLDPRTLALFLATEKLDAGKAVRLARAELVNRHDVFTHDALAWSLFADGQLRAAAAEMRIALAEGTHDARLRLHASLILPDSAQAPVRDRSDVGRAGWATLLPSERALLPAVSAEQAANQ
jgi:tetratricopeptide (TPR) repeat protein